MQSMDDTEKNLCRANNPGRTHTRHIPASWYICAIQQWHNSSHHRSYGFLDKQKYHRLNMFIFDCLFFACISVYYYWCCYFVVGCCCFFFSLYSLHASRCLGKNLHSHLLAIILLETIQFSFRYIYLSSRWPSARHVTKLDQCQWSFIIFVFIYVYFFRRWNICRLRCDAMITMVWLVRTNTATEQY